MINHEVLDAINRYYEGEETAEKTLVKLEKLNNVAKAAMEWIKAFKTDNAEKFRDLKQEYPDGFMGYMFEFRNGAKRYSFKGISEIDNIERGLKATKDHYKMLLEMKMQGKAVFDEETGEEITELPTISYSADSIILKEIKT